MKKMMLPALSALGLLAACSSGAEAPKEEAADEVEAPAADTKVDDDDDSPVPEPAKEEEDHPHDGSEGDEHKH